MVRLYDQLFQLFKFKGNGPPALLMIMRASKTLSVLTLEFDPCVISHEAVES